ncbi:S8 family serine peptidase [Halorussus sp. MSC15.2]|uniref:S8 family serine peptidase n=1 Tax=Halorussus sp. MSC15.2 TaxID=2283638 RepID=UPI0013D5D9A9|nr:S8 family serine peptidase [Halorussus sp. MSC15.2]NEU58482.1 S8 family serine peptidase [Halorussus sp. MSC15.2]
MVSPESRRALAVAVLGVLVLAGSLALLATSLSASTVGSQTTSTPATAVGPEVAALHDAGVTGENVTVGVVDVTGFDTDATALDGRVVDARAFGSDGTVRNDGRNAHGTAAAETVARVAPDADLYLTTFDSPDGFRRAVEWLVAEEVDVVVAPVSFYGMPGDGTSPVADVAERATDEGVVFVSPTGNLARSHWTGRYRGVENGTLTFGDNARNYVRGDGRDVAVWLSWDDAHREQDYTAELHWTDGSRSRLVARSSPYPGDGVPNERIVARVRSGTYYVTVRGPANATGARLELSSPTHDFQHVRSAGSLVAPASAPSVVTVGAYDATARRVEPFSSRGPTPDGRDGVDLVAPSHPDATDTEGFVGSSAAATYAGGVAALVVDERPDLAPRAVERRLETTAVDAGRPGADPVTGYGRLRPVRAVGARNATG